MSDDNIEDTSPSSSHPFFGHGGFPFVFRPSTFRTGFPFANKKSPADNQPTAESKTKEENDEASEEVEVEEKEGEETIDDDEADRNDENDDDINEKNDLRISQPKYSQLLKELDFSHTRMVDVTNLLSNELDQQANYLTPDENEIPETILHDTKYHSSSSTRSSISSDELSNQQTSNNNKIKEDEKLINAVNDIQNDLNNLAAIIQEASHLSIDKNEEENSEHLNNDLQKKHTFDEDDDTSKQATQNYDFPDNEQEDIIPSSKSSKIPRLINQYSNENKSSTSHLDTNINLQNQTPKQEEQQQAPINWNTLILGTDLTIQQSSEFIISQPTMESHSTPKKPQQQQPLTSSGEKSKPQPNPITKQKIHQKFRQSTSSSSSDTDSIVEHALNQLKPRQPSPPSQPKQPTSPIIPPQTLRQDSQATLIDSNLDDLSSHLKQIHIDQERQTLNRSTKEERTTDAIGSMSFPLSTQNILDNDISNQSNDNLLQHLSNRRIDYNQYTSDIPERLNSHKKKSHYQYHKYSTSRHIESNNGINSRKKDDNWLTMLEKLEHEHKARLEKQQQQYQDYMNNLEEKMKQHFDNYLTLTNSFQESRLDNHIHHTPIDSNIGRYKNYSHTRPLTKDLISHYYPADSTLNILTTEKKRSNIIQSQTPRDDIINLRTELSAKHAKHIADLKLYYEYEINELKSQLNRLRMGHTSSSTRQSMETIERINNENIRLHDDVNELRHSLKIIQDENILIKRQLEELREQLNNKDLDLKNYHRTITDLEQQLTEAENTKERQNEKFRHADRQALFYREENDKFKIDINLTRERLLRLEERYREKENENETLRRQLFMLENDNNRIKNRIIDDHKINSTMPMNIPTSKEYGRYTLSTTKYTPRDANIDSKKYQTNDTENLFRHTHSPRPITRITDYLNEKPIFPQPYVPPTRQIYSPRKFSPNRRRVEPISTRNSIDKYVKQNEQLEQKFDQLLKKKRDLEIRLNRIPIRGLTNTDRQLHDVLEREIQRVEQQISNIKLELRKINILRSH